MLANPTNRAILSLLTTEPAYPRRIGTLLSLSDSEVSRRLRQMEDLGLVRGEWAYIGKNVKLYELAADGIHLAFTAEGLRVDVEAAPAVDGDGTEGGDGDGAGEGPGQGPMPRTTVLNPFEVRIPDPGDLVGRADEQATLDETQGVVVVDGMPGIGKTSLVATWARDRAGDDEAVFWHSFRGVESLNWLANRFAVFLAQHDRPELLEAIEAGADEADKRELMLDAVEDPEVVVVLDDADRLDDPALRDLVSDAIRRTRQGRLIIASRERPRYNPNLDHVVHLRLEGLSDEGVAAFLEARGVDVRPELLPRLREEVGGHPLALGLFLESVRELGGGADAMERLLDGIPEVNIEDYLLEEIVQGLSDEERHVLERASLFRTRFTADDLAALCDERVDGPLFRMRTRRLVQVQGEEHGLHEVVRNFFYSRLDDKELERLHARAAAHYLDQGTIEGRLEAMHHLLSAGRRDRVLELLQEDLDLEDFDVIDAGYHTLYRDILGTFDRDEVDDDRTWALIEDEHGDIAFHRGEYDQALARYGEALAVFADLDDAHRLADLAWKRAMALHRLGRVDEAVALVQEGLEGAPAEGLERERLEEIEKALVGEGAEPEGE